MVAPFIVNGVTTMVFVKRESNDTTVFGRTIV